MTKRQTTKTWLKLPAMQKSPLIYDRTTGHVYAFSDLKCAASHVFAMKIHAPLCDYFITRVEPAKTCTTAWRCSAGHNKGHGPPGRLEMEMIAFWWQVVIYMLTEYRVKTGDEVIELVLKEWPFTTKHIIRPAQLSVYMHSSLEKYQQLALADAQTQLGLKRTYFLKSYNQLTLDVFKEELKKSNDWWGCYNPDGKLVLCCVRPRISVDRSQKSNPLPLVPNSEVEDQVDVDTLTGVKRKLEEARMTAEEKGREAEQLRKALAYLNYSIVLDGSELNQERIDEIIKIGEMAEMEGIEPGYLINIGTNLTNEFELAVTSSTQMTLPSHSASEMSHFPLFASNQNIATLNCACKSCGLHRVESLREISQSTKDVRFAERLVIHSKLIGNQNGIDVYEVPLTTLSGESPTFERYAFGETNGKTEHRTVLVLGADDLGQSNFINAIVNFILDVNAENKFRFQLKEETSHTNLIQIYDIHHVEGFTIPFSLTIVNTSCYVTNTDNFVLFRDREIAQLLLDLLEAKHGIQDVDMICYVIADTGVTSPILSIFHSDVKDNINCWQPSDHLSKDCNWRKVSQTFFTILSTMKTKSLSTTRQVLKEMSLLRATADRLEFIIRTRSEKVKEIDNVKLTITTCRVQMKVNEEKLRVAREPIELKWKSLASGAEELLGYLQKDLDVSEKDMLTSILPVLRCIKRLKEISQRNPFLTQNLFDLLSDAYQQLKLKFHRKERVEVDENAMPLQKKAVQ